MMNLRSVPIGNGYIISDVLDTLPIKSRLNELGFFKGASIDKIQLGFGGSPIAFRVCGSVIALRSDDASLITVNKS